MISVGDKVVCVNAQDMPVDAAHKPWPVEGTVYTVCGNSSQVDIPGLLLEELPRPNYRYADGREWGFRADRFRPVHKTNISIFTKIDADIFDKKPVLVVDA